MSEIPFVNALGDALEAAISTETAQARGRRAGVRLPRRRGLAVVLVALAFGGAAAAKTIIDSLTATEAATFAIQCIEGTNTSAYPLLLGVSDRSPLSACRDAYRADGHAALAAPGVQLIACVSANYSAVDVFVANGRPDQCTQLGTTPLPAGYSAAEARVYSLQQALGAVYAKHDCVSPRTLANESQAVLDRLGFSGWRARVTLTPPKMSGGPCGSFPGGVGLTGDRGAVRDVSSSSAAALDWPTRSVTVTNNRSHSMDQVYDLAAPRLLQDSGRRCYSNSGIRALARRAFTSLRAPVRFADYAELNGTQFGGGRQPLYDRGCTVVVTVETAADGRTVEVWLNTRTAPPFPIERLGEGWTGPASSDYKP